MVAPGQEPALRTRSPARAQSASGRSHSSPARLRRFAAALGFQRLPIAGFDRQACRAPRADARPPSAANAQQSADQRSGRGKRRRAPLLVPAIHADPRRRPQAHPAARRRRGGSCRYRARRPGRSPRSRRPLAAAARAVRASSSAPTDNRILIPPRDVVVSPSLRPRGQRVRLRRPGRDSTTCHTAVSSSGDRTVPRRRAPGGPRPGRLCCSLAATCTVAPATSKR